MASLHRTGLPTNTTTGARQGARVDNNVTDQDKREQLDLFGKAQPPAAKAATKPSKATRPSVPKRKMASVPKREMASVPKRKTGAAKGREPHTPSSGAASTASGPTPHTDTPHEQAADAPTPDVLGVAELDRRLKRLVEGATRDCRVEGEVASLHRAGSGHAYFSLKDVNEDALIECVMYRRAPARARRALEEGQRVVLKGRVTLYAPRGRMQFIADDVVDSRRGLLLEQLERLKKALAKEGLFDAKRKTPIPDEVRRIAVLTSRDGAAIHDIIRVAHGRGAVKLLLVPTPVQGATAPERITAAIETADRLDDVDVIVVTRGGGSAEDLAAYNDERVVRAIAAAKTPIVSAVGHEIDTSLSDLVADMSAATPSQAAELLVADDQVRRAHLRQHEARLGRAAKHLLVQQREQLGQLRRRLGEPRRQLLECEQRFDELGAAAERAIRRRLASRRQHVDALTRRLAAQQPSRVIAQCQAKLRPLEPMMAAAMRSELQRRAKRLSSLNGRLEALSPLAVLERGYSIATTVEGTILTAADAIVHGDAMTVRLHRGRLHVRVEDSDLSDS